MALYSSGAENRGMPHLLYNLGRLISYLTIGIVAGLIGAAIDKSAALVGIGHLAAIVMSVVLIVLGLRSFFSYSLKAPSWFTNLYGDFLGRIQNLPATRRSFLIGLISTFLPCGWLYSFAAVAATSGTLLGSVGTMFIFWIGTVPIMLLVGPLLATVITPIKSLLPKLSATFLILAGVFSLFNHLDRGSEHQHHHVLE